jgi:acetyltransferase-like isoleucine patch superfamily enzyme
MRLLWAVLQLVLPMPLKRRVGNWFFGWDVHPTAHIGRSMIMVGKLVMGPHSSIGSFNTIRGLEEVVLEEGASIATRNLITGFPPGSDHFAVSPNRRSVLVLRRHSMVTIGHTIDCADRVELGEYSAIAGYRCAILTHSLDLARDRFVAQPVVIGDRSAVMSGCTLLNGTSVPSRAIVSAGSVVTTKLTTELTFYRGNPAEPVRALPERLKYFRRGLVEVASAE